MKFGVNTFLWSAAFTAEHFPKLKTIRDYGFDGVEVSLFKPEEFPANEIRRALEENGLECTVCSVLLPGFSLISPDENIRRTTIHHLSACIEKTAEAGAKIIAGPLYHPVGSFSGIRRTESEWTNAVCGYRELAPVLERNRVHLCIEPLNRFETYFLNTTADAVRLCDEVNHPYVGILWDTFHANIEEKNLHDSLVSAARHLKHVHTCENDRGTPGSGHVDWNGVFRALTEIGYDGWLTIESFGFSLGELSAAAAIWRDLAPTSDEIASAGVRFLKQRAQASESTGNHV
ncbi:MAG: sugar phosphate isomerase/epimerase [Acidobacteriaceae bacterium]|nr:sugar phosphate isomerase/epimerase [Acidobacteriaceae bacterium]